jgi:PAS domain S-box-containing protein
MVTPAIAASTSEQATAHHMHTVQFYVSDDFLVDELARFFSVALIDGQSAVIVATKAHQETLARRLEAYGVKSSQAAAQGRYFAFDAGELLSRFLVDGQIDQFRFFEVVGEVISRASSAARDEKRSVVVFGEMVALLWAEGKTELAIQLEKLWNALARTYSFSLRCAYPMQGFSFERDAAALAEICGQHTAVVAEAAQSSETKSAADSPQPNGRSRKARSPFPGASDRGEREEHFREFVEAVQDYAIFMLDTEGRIVSWSAGAERIKGYTRGEILGSHFSRFYPPEDVQAGKPQKLLDLARKFGRTEDEGWRLRNDGTRFWAHVNITAIRNDAGELIGFGKVTRDLTEQKRTEAALHRQEERFQLFVHTVQDYAIFMLDPDGYVTTWNLGAERIKGYKASEIIGKHFSCFYPPGLRAEKPKRALEIAAREGHYEIEDWRLRKDGSRFWASVAITAIRDDSGNLIGFGKVTRDLTERMLAQKTLESSQGKLRDSERALRELSLHLLRSQDEERRRIGREIHDSLGQYLSVLKIKLESMNAPAECSRDVNACTDLVDTCLKEVRTVSYLLYPPMLEEMGLRSAVPWYLDGFSRRSGIKTSFHIPDDFGRLGRDAELVLFRVLQECLTNVQRHSGSPTAEIRIAREEDAITLEVADQGKGLPAAVMEQGGQDWMGSLGVGLRGMSERLQQLGGSLDISSNGHGTRVRATVPLQKMPSAAVPAQK